VGEPCFVDIARENIINDLRSFNVQALFFCFIFFKAVILPVCFSFFMKIR